MKVMMVEISNINNRSVGSNRCNDNDARSDNRNNDNDYDEYGSSYVEGNGDYANNSLGINDDINSKTAITIIIKINNYFYYSIKFHCTEKPITANVTTYFSDTITANDMLYSLLKSSRFPLQPLSHYGSKQPICCSFIFVFYFYFLHLYMSYITHFCYRPTYHVLPYLYKPTYLVL